MNTQIANREGRMSAGCASRWISGLAAGMIAAGSLIADGTPKPSDWPMFGQNASNTAYNSTETAISTKTVGQFKAKWTFTTGGDVSARAAVVNGVVYFPDWGGNLFALNAANGKLIWGKQLSSYNLLNLSTRQNYAQVYARATPAISNGILYL